MADDHLMARLLAQRWPLTSVTLGATIREFDTRVVRAVGADQGRFVVKMTNQWRDERDAVMHLAIFDFLPRHGFAHIPRLLRTRDDLPYCRLGSQFAYVLEYIDGQAPEPTELNYFRIGTMLGALHAFVDYSNPYLFTYQQVRPEFDQIARELPFADAYMGYVRGLPDFDVLPQTLIHGEVIGNTLQKADRAMIILDWDEAGVGPRVFDIGHPLLSAFITEELELHEAHIHAFYGGYFSKVALQDREIQHIFDVALFYALRYIVYGDTQKRWRRLQWAVSHRDTIMSAIYSALDAAQQPFGDGSA